MKRRPALLWAAVLAGGLGLWAGHRLGPVPAQQSARTAAAAPVEAAAIGQPLPALVLPDLHGTPVDLRGFAGRPLLINVWASWCGPCVEEMPELARFAATQGAQGVQVVGLALDTPEAVQAFLARVPVDYPIVLDTPGPADASVRLGNAQGLLPYSVLVDAQGRLVRQRVGPFEPGTLDAWTR
ncbi:TlpA disulfide reductase family protein [Xanthomonas sp. 60]